MRVRYSPCYLIEEISYCATRCFGIMKIMPSSSCLVYLDVIDIEYINLVVWIFDLNFVPYCLWGCLLTFHLEMWVGNYSGRYITTEQLYWAGLHWGCRTEHSVPHLGLELWDVISMWLAVLEVELSVPRMFCLHVNMLRHTLSLTLFLRSYML